MDVMTSMVPTVWRFVPICGYGIEEQLRVGPHFTRIPRVPGHDG